MSWLQNIPNDLLRRQLTTFSKTLSVMSAMEIVASLDYRLALDFSHGAEAELLSLLGAEQGTIEFSKNHTKSDKEIEIPHHGKLPLQSRLRAEYQLLRHVVSGLNS